MLTEVMAAVSCALKKAFGIAVYGAEKPMQEFKTPSFLINLIQVSDRERLGNSFHRKIPLDIQYFPKNEEDLTELWKISDTITRDLQWLTLKNGDVIRGTELRCETIDGNLNCFVTYILSMRTVTVEEADMEELLLETGKDGE